MTNTAMLEEAIANSGLKIGAICDALKLSRQGFKNKRKGLNEFTVDEVLILCKILNISKGKREAIFFAK